MMNYMIFLEESYRKKPSDSDKLRALVMRRRNYDISKIKRN